MSSTTLVENQKGEIIQPSNTINDDPDCSFGNKIVENIKEDIGGDNIEIVGFEFSTTEQKKRNRKSRKQNEKEILKTYMHEMDDLFVV
jgi:hypothetical protein